MIANALDADGTFTAAQVSRKLKQLGLRVAQQKRPKAETHLKDEDVINFSAETAEHSDNETLLSLKKRSKNKKIERENKDMENQKIEGKVSQDSSEDEFPGSVSGDGHEQPSGMEVDDDGTLNRAVNAEAQAASISSEKQVGTIDANNLQHQQLHDELEDQLSDLGDDATPVTSQNVLKLSFELGKQIWKFRNLHTPLKRWSLRSSEEFKLPALLQTLGVSSSGRICAQATTLIFVPLPEQQSLSLSVKFMLLEVLQNFCKPLERPKFRSSGDSFYSIFGSSNRRVSIERKIQATSTFADFADRSSD
ncbi:hypothetical protein HYC85_026009 [Camellia sinensis]|uniref:Uncharacterized protein n=1 Tax=Camellia sinensis TaxID=4442 RepID=A0A7J7G2C4_CAMSI|nr:hypothetical protein HYC85_026009 [Camellia sinensis]